MRKQALSLIAGFTLLASAAQAQSLSFIEILRGLTPGKAHIVSEVPELNSLLKARSIQEAQNLLVNKNFPLNNSVSANNLSVQTQELLSRRTLTVLIVPGVLGEFIETRAFEEVFARSSSFKSRWQSLVQQSRSQDARFSLDEMKDVAVDLNQVIHAASIDNAQGRALLKVVLLKTEMGSMESVGDNATVAAIFNRRLAKYIQLTNDQNIVMLGYSRGTSLALEMLSQLRKNNSASLSKIKALVSYAGVSFGSSLADATGDLSTANGVLFAAADEMEKDLQTSDSLLDRPLKRAHNTKAIAKMAMTLAKNSEMDPKALLSNARSGDFKTIAALILQMTGQLGLNDVTDFNGHVVRTKKMIRSILNAVVELRSANRTQWWKTHTLPANLRYLSLPAVMVDPEASSQDKSIFMAREGYSQSLDDQSLIQNMRAYKEMTGIALNDSQVAIHQSMFLPQVIAQLNPANAGLKIETLGILQTHHWGASLQVVNKMKDGRLNPFPREKVLMAIGAYLNQ